MAVKYYISRWIKEILDQSGIDTNYFSGYSVKHASTSTAKRNGVSTDTIRATAGWSENSKNFVKYYDLKIVDNPGIYANTILD